MENENKKAKKGVSWDSRGSVQGEYVAAALLVGLLGVGGFTTLGTSMQKDIGNDANGKGVAVSAMAAGEAPPGDPSFGSVATVSSGAASADTITINCDKDPSACERVIRGSNAKDHGNANKGWMDIAGDVFNGVSSVVDYGVNVIDAVAPGKGFFGDDGLFSKVGSFADMVLPGKGLNPIEIAKGTIPLVLSGPFAPLVALHERILPGDGILGEDGFLSIATDKISGGFSFAGDVADQLLPGEGLNPINVLDGMYPGHGFFGDDGFFTGWIPDVIGDGFQAAGWAFNKIEGGFSFAGDVADQILPGEGLNPFNVLDGVLPGHGYGTGDGFVGWGADKLDTLGHWTVDGLDTLGHWTENTARFAGDRLHDVFVDFAWGDVMWPLYHKFDVGGQVDDALEEHDAQEEADAKVSTEIQGNLDTASAATEDAHDTVAGAQAVINAFPGGITSEQALTLISGVDNAKTVAQSELKGLNDRLAKNDLTKAEKENLENTKRELARGITSLDRMRGDLVKQLPSAAN